MEVRMPIVGQYVSPDKIEISIPRKERIQEGQRVLVCKPTNNTIVNYATGKVIGRKEQVVGTGIIKVEGGNYVVKTDKSFPVINLKGMKVKDRDYVVKASKNSPMIQPNEATIKIGGRAMFQSKKINLSDKAKDVIIKIIED